MQPARPDAGPVRLYTIDRKSRCPLPDHDRKIDTGMYRVVDRPGQPRVNFHQQRAVVGIAAEFDLAHALHADGCSQANGRGVDILRNGYALPHNRGAAQWRTGPVRSVPATGQDLPVDDEQRHPFAATACPFLSENAQTRTEEPLGHIGGLAFIDDLGGYEAITQLLRP